MAHTAKGKDALRDRRERALDRRREELRKWIEPRLIDFDLVEEVHDPLFRQVKIDRAIQDVEHLEKRLGVKK